MVAKNPFLFERDHEARFLARNEGAYRGLANLFPAASLEKLTRFAHINSQKRLTMGRHVVQVQKTGRRAMRVFVSQAAKTLAEEVPGAAKSYAGYQRYLDLSCDMRLQHAMVGEYTLHSYGIPLSLLYGLRGWATKPLKDDIAWRAYFLDRLLFEDGDYIKGVLELASEGLDGKTSNRLGADMHEAVFSRLRSRQKDPRFPYVVRNLIKTKIEEYERPQSNDRRRRSTSKHTNHHPNEDQEPDEVGRRTELEFTVRRDWLVELGVMEPEGDKYRLTGAGRRLAQALRTSELTPEFFTNGIFGVIKDALDLGEKSRIPIPSLEKWFSLSSGGKQIVETLVMTNSAIFGELPTYVGERDDVLSQLLESVASGQTNLVVQSGYRTKDYYVKLRPGR
jgi:hypothetical protein